ncbi:MAG: (d)CMP kinase, partial [Bacteroidota bacterium]
YFLENQVELTNEKEVATALSQIQIEFVNRDGQNRTFLNGKDVEEEIREMYVSQSVSPVAAVSAVRRALVAQQQQMGKKKGVILDGRDIGTVVFPDAELKLFLTASPAVRAKRRQNELVAKGRSVDFEAVKANLIERDNIDSSRADSPLKQAEDAVVLDNSNLTKNEQLAMVCALVEERMKRKDTSVSA